MATNEIEQGLGAQASLDDVLKQNETARQEAGKDSVFVRLKEPYHDQVRV